jgi:hypothetical protein
VGGILTESARSSLVEYLLQGSFDLLYVEYEHVFFDPAALADTVLCARDNSLPVIAKTPRLESATAAKLFDCGVVSCRAPSPERTSRPWATT